MEKTPKCPSFFLIGCSSFVWYMVLFNHTEIHHAFTYRIFGIGICAFFAIVIESTHTATEKWPGLRRCLAFCVFSLLLLVSACVLTLYTKEITPIDKKTCYPRRSINSKIQNLLPCDPRLWICKVSLIP